MLTGDWATIVYVLVGTFLCLSLLSIKYFSQASEESKRAGRSLVICVAIVVVCSFEMISQFCSPQVEADGVIVESHEGSGRASTSYFRFQLPSGKIVRLATVATVARSLHPAETAHVIYETWSGKALQVSISSGESAGLVVMPRDKSFPVFLLVVLLVVLGGAIWSAVKLRRLSD